MSGLVEAMQRRDTDAIAQLCAAEVVFNSPVDTYQGVERAATLLGVIAGVVDELEIVRELEDGDELVTFVTAFIGDEAVDGVVAQTIDDHDRLSEITLMLRPLQGLLAGVEQMRRRLG
jgi:limonene-1,2-epoxide hydrolase